MKRKLTLYLNRILHLFEVRRIKTKRKAVFLTFDDGPEPGITEFVLEELSKYDFKATFFCRGDNAAKYPELLSKIQNEGHALGNHTYSHLNGFDTPSKDYVSDVEKADAILHTHLFRPPWGSITLRSYLRLFRKYRIVYWSLMSGDTSLEKFDKKKQFDKLCTLTRTGDVILFHSCLRHEKETRQLLPDYLDWLRQNGYTSDIIK